MAEVLRDQSYGAHERHRLDIYRPSNASRAPILILFHGGGFIRGDKADRENLGRWGASKGWLTILANYRLAPQNTWPSGPQDVIAAWKFVQSNAMTLGGDPNQIVLMGESAGSAHVAAATLMRRFQPDNWSIRGAVLLSGPYNAGLEADVPEALNIATPDLRNTAYFGENRSIWHEASIVDQVDASPFPLLIAAAECDLLQMQVQAGELFARLVREHGFRPDLHWWRGHNHFTPGGSIGSQDTTVSDALDRFVNRVTSA